ncbi:AraC family transcriptional regulator [Paenibacillus validus]|nr:helix-turn-helix domain-containing protein [Paenibacillus validus]
MISNLIGSIRLVDLQYTIGHKGYAYGSHRHTIFEFMYVISGQFEQIVNGQPYVLGTGDCLIIKPGMFHHTPPIHEDAEWFVFHFEVEDKRIHEILQLIQHPVIKKDKEKSIHNFVNTFIDEYGYFLHNLSAPETEKTSESKYAAVIMLKVQSSILNLISLLSDYFYHQSESAAPPSIQPSLLNLAHEAAYWIEKRAIDPIRIGELASQLNVDRSHLTNCFKKVYGISPRGYLTKVRIRMAKGLLTDTDWSIEKISQELQFSSPAHFIKFFLKDVGLTPLKFRNHTKTRTV